MGDNAWWSGMEGPLTEHSTQGQCAEGQYLDHRAKYEDLSHVAMATLVVKL